MFAFLAPYLAELAGSAAWSFVKAYWKPILFASVGLAVLVTIAVQRHIIANRDAYISSAKAALSDAIDANNKSAQAVEDLKKAQADAAVAAAKSIAKSAAISASHETAKKEMHNEAGAQDTAGPYYDNLAGRLKLLDSESSQGNSH